MGRQIFMLDLLREPQIAVRATSPLPVWLFDPSGARLLFANPAGAAMFGFTSSRAAASASFDNTDVARQLARSAATLRTDGSPRLERLRGMGMPFGQSLVCACSKITIASEPAILIVASQPCGPSLTLKECAARLIEGLGAVAAFDPAGHLLDATVGAADRVDVATAQAGPNGAQQTLYVGEGETAVTLVLFDEQPASHRASHDAEPVASRISAVESVDLSPIADAMAAMSAPQSSPRTGDIAKPTASKVPHREQAVPLRPLRFAWEADADSRFTISADQFLALAGPRTSRLQGRFWNEVSAKLALDPDGRITQALIARETLSAIRVSWPIETGERIAVELRAIPVFDDDRTFRGFRGWGVCPDLSAPLPPIAEATADPETSSDDTEPVSFLAARLKGADQLARGQIEKITVAPAAMIGELPRLAVNQSFAIPALEPEIDDLAGQRPLLDPLPVGILIYRRDSFLYANPAFLHFTAHASLGDFVHDGGLDTLFIEARSDASNGAQNLRVAAQHGRTAVDGRLTPIALDGEPATALILFPPALPTSADNHTASEFIAKLSHDMREPLSTIIGFSEIVMKERFGALGNERYVDYLKDIHSSGLQLISVLNDLENLSRIESGKVELNFERVNLNDVVQQAVSAMQTEATRARVVIRTALSMNVPRIVADASSVGRIVANLVANSLKLAGAGGQIIVSTAAPDRGDVMLRIRNTGRTPDTIDAAPASQPFNPTDADANVGAFGTDLDLPLTRALIEANRARFSIRNAAGAGTLVEIAFPAERILTN